MACGHGSPSLECPYERRQLSCPLKTPFITSAKPSSHISACGDDLGGCCGCGGRCGGGRCGGGRCGGGRCGGGCCGGGCVGGGGGSGVRALLKINIFPKDVRDFCCCCCCFL